MIGENKKSPYIIENLKLAQEGYGDSFLLKTYKKTEVKLLINDLKNDDNSEMIPTISERIDILRAIGRISCIKTCPS